MLKLWYPDITKENFLQCCHIATTFLVIRYRIFFFFKQVYHLSVPACSAFSFCLVCFLSLKLFKPTLVKMRTWSFKSTDLKCNTQRNLRFNKIEERIMGLFFYVPELCLGHWKWCSKKEKGWAKWYQLEFSVHLRLWNASYFRHWGGVLNSI